MTKKAHPRKVAVVTGTRADYGLLFNLMKEIQADPALKLQLIVTGMHLSKDFGNTQDVIKADGFTIDERVAMDTSDDSTRGVTKSMGQAVIGFADAYASLQPDLVVVLGDRYEMLAGAQAAMIARLPLLHIHGGEATEGLIDEAIRHAITKMSHLHYVTADEHRRRVIQLGEQPDKVFTVGAPGLDNIQKLKLLGREEFEKAVNFKLGKLNFLVTYHPMTLSHTGSEGPMRELLTAFEEFPEAHILFTLPNSDPGGRVIIELINEFVRKSGGRAIAQASLGQLRYLSAIKNMDVVIGNSSSGLVEVPFMKKPTIDIGDRQRGRLRASSVIHCGESKGEIVASIKKALSSAFQSALPNTVSMYGNGGTAPKIKEGIKAASLEGIIMKNFFNLDYKL